jgi:serine/threonine protein kinase/TPR repeat protein
MAEPLIFDHYEVLLREDGSLFELGRGAMGTTYKAFDTNLRIPVALKVINAAFLDSEVARQRFVREARSAAQLRHRNVASVFHLGTQAGSYFYAMEFIDGETVEACIRREGMLEPVLALGIASQVARALGAAERLGLVHRDIKPANLMLVNEDDELLVKVIDFGLAKSLKPDEEAVTMTMSGFVGTPHFASPEQLEERDIDVRSDIYSLGATLWYMLAGRAPFAGSLAQVMSQHLHKPPPFEHFAQWPKAAVEVMSRMLEKDPANRYQTPTEAREALEGAAASLQGTQDYPTLAESLAGSVDLAREEFSIGRTIAGKYEIVEALGESALGPVFRAQCAGESVRLTALSAALGAAEIASLQEQVQQTGALAPPNLVKPLAALFEGGRGWLVEEWTNGFTFAEMLRVRGELRPGEVIALFKPAAEGVDFAIRAQLTKLALSLPEAFVHFPGAAATEQMPVADWPEYCVKLRAVRIERALTDSATWAGGQTLVEPGSAVPQEAGHNISATYIQALSAMAYELLGGASLLDRLAAQAGTPLRYVPLASLTEQGNEVLKHGLEIARSFPTAGEWLQALQVAEVDRISGQPRVPAKIAPQPGEATQAALAPKKKSALPLVIGGFAGLALAVGVVMFLTHRAPEKIAEVLATPLATPAPTPEIVQTTPTPVPTPSREDLLKKALAEAQDFEAQADWTRALGAYLQMAKDFPESDAAKTHLQLLLMRIRKAPQPLPDAQFELLKPMLTDAAKLDVVSAMMLLGDGFLRSDPLSSFAWYCAAAQHGEAEAVTRVGLMYSNGAGVVRDFKKAVEWFQRAAEAGDKDGMTSLAECELLGKGTAEDPGQAVDWLQKAVALNDPRAMDRLATCYSHGTGVPVDYAKAFQLYAQAKDLGYLASLGNLGALYAMGRGVPANPEKAVQLFKEGAEKGNAMCMASYAQCFEMGFGGVQQDLAQATTWYQAAAKGGDLNAIGWCRAHQVEVPKP